MDVLLSRNLKYFPHISFPIGLVGTCVQNINAQHSLANGNDHKILHRIMLIIRAEGY